ncbi:sulfotransferase [Novosphingobium sp. TH158]|uniref:sulfotransferase family protein n=1 Tax=Novosphingobium sp. TH158 TaxID=2067455 RepID=UPI000C7D83F3|nr:sulfotransferase [Novosphingobium sp. TH158]PLK26704.1 hypothetical protein C0V78_07245 [Novosphingobium sp. TH158]
MIAKPSAFPDSVRGLALRLLGIGTAPRNFVVFIGNPRSGTTLVRSLLNAHPNVVIANEFNILAAFQQGERDWRRVLGGIRRHAAWFDAKPVWQGYDYRINARRKTPASAIRVIGDKKAGRTTLLFARHPELLEAFLAWCPVPVKFIHCVRHPLDVIATKTARNAMTLDENIDLYFQREAETAQICERVGPDACHSVYLEELIAQPRRTLAELARFLGIVADGRYAESCAGLIFADARQTREGLSWSPDQLDRIARDSAAIQALAGYAMPVPAGIEASSQVDASEPGRGREVL